VDSGELEGFTEDIVIFQIAAGTVEPEESEPRVEGQRERAAGYVVHSPDIRFRRALLTLDTILSRIQRSTRCPMEMHGSRRRPSTFHIVCEAHGYV